MVKIAPSILAADPLNLERDARRMEEAGCDWIHVDVMDAHFVPNLAYTPDVVRRLRQTISVPLDVHLMMDHPETLLDAFLDAGADILTIHSEADVSAEEMIRRIHSRKIRAGIAIKPRTDPESIRGVLDQADLILTMTVEPGFGGQKLDEHVPAKMKKLREMGYRGWIEADGGIDEGNLPHLIACGLDVAVMGTALFRDKDPSALISRLHGLGDKRE